MVLVVWFKISLTKVFIPGPERCTHVCRRVRSVLSYICRSRRMANLLRDGSEVTREKYLVGGRAEVGVRLLNCSFIGGLRGRELVQTVSRFGNIS